MGMRVPSTLVGRRAAAALTPAVFARPPAPGTPKHPDPPRTQACLPATTTTTTTPSTAAAAPADSAPAPPTLSMDSLEAFIGSNPYFTAGFGLMGLGAGLTIARRGFQRLSQLMYRQLVCDLEIASKDASYDWFLDWMARQPKRSSRNFAVETAYTRHDNGSITADFVLVPGPGTHIVSWNGAYILVKRERSQRLMDISNGRPYETLLLKTLYMHRGVFSEMLSAAQRGAERSQAGKTVLYTSFGPDWRPFGQPRRKRSLDSVVLANGVKERLVRDLTSFLESQDWYAQRGIPYRRGYLLYGPPGSGKTSLIQALAAQLDYNICILNLAELTLTDDRLNHLLNNVPARSFVLLEDIDAAFVQRRQKSDFGTGITFSGLLNALDGVTSADERIVFMTTNHPERLDPALIRPGRVDVKELLDNATPSQIRTMFTRFYGAESEALAAEFLALAVSYNRPVSAAQLQGLFVFHKDDPHGAIAAFRKANEHPTFDAPAGTDEES